MTLPGTFYLRYLRGLRELIRSRKDNPLIVYGRARQSRWRRILLLTLVLIMWAAWVGMVFQSPDGMVGSWVTALIFGTPLVVAVCFFLFASPLRTKANLEDLHLTLLSRREIAFGAVWPPAVLATQVFLLFYLTCVGMMWLVEYNWAVNVEELWLLFLSAPVVLLCSLGIAARMWISHGHRWPVLLFFRLGLLHVVSLMVFYALMGIGMVTVGNLFSYGLSSIPYLVPAVLFPFLALGLFWLYQAGRFAGDRFFAPIDPETLASKYWLVNERLARKEKRARREGMRRLSGVLREGRWCDRWGLAAALGLLAVGVLIGLPGEGDWRRDALRGAFGLYAVMAASVVAPGVSLYLRARGRPDVKLPVVSGSLSDSAYRYFRRTWFVLLPLFVGGPVYDIASEGGEWGNAIPLAIGAVACLALAAFLGLYVTFWLLPRGRRREIAGAWIGAAVVFHLAAALGMETDRHSMVFFYETSDAAVKVVMVLLLPLMYLLLLGGAEYVAQRLHNREARGATRHRLTVECEAPEEGLAIADSAAFPLAVAEIAAAPLVEDRSAVIENGERTTNVK